MTSVHEAASDEMVTCPPHYMAGPYECKEVERELSAKIENEGTDLTPYEARLYFAAFEYVWRAPFKGDIVRDLEKAAEDIQELVKTLEAFRHGHESD